MKTLTLILLPLLISINVFGQVDKEYTSLAEARKTPLNVYKLNVTALQDTILPQEIFLFTNLTELRLAYSHIKDIIAYRRA